VFTCWYLILTQDTTYHNPAAD